MSIIQLNPRQPQGSGGEPQDQFEARLEAMSGAGDSPAVKRPSPFARVVRTPPQPPED